MITHVQSEIPTSEILAVPRVTHTIVHLDDENRFLNNVSKALSSSDFSGSRGNAHPEIVSILHEGQSLEELVLLVVEKQPTILVIDFNLAKGRDGRALLGTDVISAIIDRDRNAAQGMRFVVYTGNPQAAQGRLDEIGLTDRVVVLDKTNPLLIDTETAKSFVSEISGLL